MINLFKINFTYNFRKFIILALLTFIFATQAMAKQAIVIAISGYGVEKTAPDLLESMDVKIGTTTPPVWSLLPTKKSDQRISKSFYLTHNIIPSEVARVVSFFANPDKSQKKPCRDDLKLFVMAHSWGAVKALAIASAFEKKCGRRVDLMISLDAIQKPTTLPFRTEIPSEVCVNFYQVDSLLHGAEVPRCQNVLLKEERGGLADGHYDLSIHAGAFGKQIMLMKIQEN